MFIYTKFNKKILDLFEYKDNTFKFKTNYITPADWFIYQNTNTYVYKYNIIIQNCTESTIHNNHLGMHNYSINFNNKILLSNLNNGIIKELCNK